MNENRKTTSRRRFIAAGSGAIAGLTVLPARVLGRQGQVPPSDRITAACVGVGSQGMRVMMELMKFPEFQVVSVCDPNRGSEDFIEWGPGELRSKVRALLGDPNWGAQLKGAWCGQAAAKTVVEAYYARQTGTSYKGCTAYADFRELLEKERDVDAVVVGTPDHVHAAASLAALRRGKHVFCQKPMTRTVEEARMMAKAAAAEPHLATQVATMNAASEATRVLTEWVQAGAAGEILEVHNWSSRPFWPQGMDRPEESVPVPEYLDWDLWLGPAPERPFHPAYQPFVWRGWIDFGAGAIGDMGCYSFDTIFRVLGIGQPGGPRLVSVEGSGVVPYLRKGNQVIRFENRESYPAATTNHFELQKTNGKTLHIYWYDGGLRPTRPDFLPTGQELAAEGMLLVGSDGAILCGFNGDAPRLLPAAKAASFEPPKPTLPRSPGLYQEWLQGCRGQGGKPIANFEFAAGVTEMIVLGTIAARLRKKLYWDGEKFTNDSAANELLSTRFRPGWNV